MNASDWRKLTPFGVMLRAARLCFVYVPSKNCFMRFSERGDNLLVEVRPNSLGALDGPTEKACFMPDDVDALIGLSIVLSAITEVTSAVDLLLDDSGELVV